MTPPVLTTARLTLEGPDPADLPDFAAMWADPLVYAMIGGRAFTREETWHRVLRHIGHWQVVGYGNWTIRERASGRIAGSVGLMDSRRDTVPSFEGTPEMGWALCSWAHGRGFGGEAVAAALGWADAQGIARTVCIIDPANTASIGLAGKMGYVRVADATYRDAPTLLFARAAPDVSPSASR
ncbi:GNAT family N-acetyltransferase [Sphingomonas ginsenosidivorax]|uniref:GNAT family N-acetyltransferase n=1 Tax=Sphingomonas ginsenosidivorax TaxID=862135 RepID=A0A5C6UJE2_9SPHN|nr:GNAT family N-acetyltransferase [Sphingomonas ginsenosidivorax]TXC72381.1 GNAT family N-acetyltransferase [Sphingomonas ginsenosidivorax]